MNTRAALRALVVASIVAAGCKDSIEPTLPEFSFTPATQWSGGTITIRSQFFVDYFHLLIIVAGTDTLPLLSLVNDSTVLAQLPPGPSGQVTLSLVRGTRHDSVGTIERVGFTGKRTVTPALYGELLATDSAGAPFVLGGSFTGTANREPVVRLRVVPGTSQVLTLREPSNTQYGLAPSVIPGAFTVRDATDSLRLATLLVDAPVIIDSMLWAGTGFTRQVSLLKPGAWLMTDSHDSFVRYDTGGTLAPVPTESPWAVYMSPTGNRTTLATSIAGGSGVPVWDNATGLVAFTLPVPFTEAAAFSTNVNTLYVVGGQLPGSDTVIAVNAATGALIARKALPNGLQGMGIAYREGVGGGELLVGAATASNLAIVVYRASTLELLGILPTGDGCPDMQTGPCFSGVVSLDDLHDRAYIVIPGNPTPIWAFDLLP
ncbi:MAG TPA: IPT/TIG domain-containing protein [Gemmatimonadales bacterium]|nr:IPT/TIG domain-containing protein [Gemmatimonadales bacterium]